MQPLATVRNWQFDQLRKSLPVVRYIVQTVSADDMRTYRDGGTGWTALEVLCHLRDWEVMFQTRVRITVEQDNPELPNADPDRAALENRYNEQDIAGALDLWSQRRETYLAYLAELDESVWQRTARHPTRGLMTLMDQLALSAWHDVNHIDQMTKILTERKPSV